MFVLQRVYRSRFGWHIWLALVGHSDYTPLTILRNIELFKGSRKVNGVAEVCNIPVLVTVQVAHRETVTQRTCSYDYLEGFRRV